MAEVSIYCPHCQRHTALSAAQTRYTSQRIADASVQTVWHKNNSENWWIGICNCCKEPVLVLNKGDRVYPQPLPTPTDPNVPKELAEDLNEAKLCFSTGCFRACAAMARRCIQSACIAKGAKSKDLVAQIAELAAAGVITKDIEEWATVVRWVGNDSVHPGKDPVVREDAEDCLKLAEQFLHVIFVTPAIAKARKAARGK